MALFEFLQDGRPRRFPVGGLEPIFSNFARAAFYVLRPGSQDHFFGFLKARENLAGYPSPLSAWPFQYLGKQSA